MKRMVAATVRLPPFLTITCFSIASITSSSGFFRLDWSLSSDHETTNRLFTAILSIDSITTRQSKGRKCHKASQQWPCQMLLRLYLPN